MLCGKGLLVALWYSNVEGFAFHCLPGSSPDIIDSTFYLTVFTWKEYVFTLAWLKDLHLENNHAIRLYKGKIK